MYPPPPLIKQILLYTLVVLHYIYHIQIAFLIKGEGWQNAQKQFIIKVQVTNFVQTCSLIFLYNGMYTVCTYDTPP